MNLKAFCKAPHANHAYTHGRSPLVLELPNLVIQSYWEPPKHGIYSHIRSCIQISLHSTPPQKMSQQQQDPPISPSPRAMDEPDYFILQTMMDTDISNHPPLITTPPVCLLLDKTGIESVESPLYSSHLPNISNSIIPNSFPDMSNPSPIQTPSMALFDNILVGLLREAHSHITSMDCKIQKLNDEKINLLDILSQCNLELLTQDNTIEHLQ